MACNARGQFWADQVHHHEVLCPLDKGSPCSHPCSDAAKLNHLLPHGKSEDWPPLDSSSLDEVSKGAGTIANIAY
jgi:hypothetical protein